LKSKQDNSDQDRYSKYINCFHGFTPFYFSLCPRLGVMDI